MRSAVAFAVVLLILAGCKKSSATTAPVISDTFSVAGPWGGCITEPHATCVPVTMTLSDSSLTDSTANITGTGNWGETVVIKGKFVDSTLTLNATTVGVLQGWSYSGVLSGSSITGNISIPGVDSTYQAVFTRSP
jgi:hypothetical protein